MSMLSRQALRALTPAWLLVGRTSAAAFAAGAVLQAPTIPAVTRDAIEGLEPAALWEHFAALSSIPRPSGREEAALNFIKRFAESKNLVWKEDDAGNLCVFRPGTGVGGSASPVIIQGHVDMVTEKNSDTAHDFNSDPILMRRFVKDDRNWIGAQGTTLGADNGMGVAAALSLLGIDPNEEGGKPLPPIQALFTVDEETGLHGAAKLDAEALGLTGKTMLNLDMEEWGDLFVGCAGGGDSNVEIPIKRNISILGEEVFDLMEVRVDGLMGGHSGLNIAEGRGNGVLLCATATKVALEAAGPGKAALISMSGGDKHNAIPREASAIIAVLSTAATKERIKNSIRAAASAAVDEFGLLEKGLRIQAKEIDDSDLYDSPPLDEESATRLLSSLLALPHGPIKFSHALPGLVETSNNVASVSVGVGSAKVLCSSRSSIGSALENTRDRIKAVAFLAGGNVAQSKAYPGWAPNPRSCILDVSKRLLEERLGHEAGVKAVHAGLECGLLIEKLGEDIDVISFGPTIEGAHSPDERVDSNTVAPFFEFLQDILADYATRI